MTQEELTQKIVTYFEVNIFEKHIQSSINYHSKLKTYNINPIIVKYLSIVLENDYNPMGVAKALFYPRVLGTSINTSFGAQIQKMFVKLGIARGSLIKGMDIEFIDKLDNRQKWCQLKAGPNTINSGDIGPIKKEFINTINLARTNDAYENIRNTDFIVGVIYGDREDLSMHYKFINESYPVYIGHDFWYRVTGFETFYQGLVTALHVSIESLNTKDFLNLGANQLAKEISESSLFEFEEK